MFEDEERTESGLRTERMSDRDIGTARSAASYVKRIDYSCVNKADICIIEMLLFDSQAMRENGRVPCTCINRWWSGFVSSRLND